MNYYEVKGDLLKTSNAIKSMDMTDFIYLHCIASDYHMSGGIAVPLAKELDIRKYLDDVPEDLLVHPTAVYTPGIINMITKERSSDLPSYENFIASLRRVRGICKDYDLKRIALPQIGCGIDKLSWDVISALIKEFFKDMEIEIKVVIYAPETK